MSWKKAADYAASTKAPGRYLKVPDGDQVTVTPIGDPVVQYQVWADGKSESVPPGTKDAQARYSAEVYSWETEEVHVLAMAPGLFQTVAGKLKGEHDKIVIARDGEGLKTKYSVVRVGACSSAEIAAIQAARTRQDWTIEEAVQGAYTIDEAQRIVDEARAKKAATPEGDIPF